VSKFEEEIIYKRFLFFQLGLGISTRRASTVYSVFDFLNQKLQARPLFFKEGEAPKNTLSQYKK